MRRALIRWRKKLSATGEFVEVTVDNNTHSNDEWEEEEIEKEVRRMKGILGKDVDEEPEVELPDEEMKLRELRKDYDDSEFV